MLQVLLAIDQLFNTVFGGFADETLSSRAYRTEQNGKWFGKIARPTIDTLFFFQKGHCKRAYQAEVLKLQQPRQVQDGSLS